MERGRLYISFVNQHNPKMKGITSITFFEYSPDRRWWAFNQMRLAIETLRKNPGIRFFKLMGTGGGFGFALKPDLRTYALLIVWEDPVFAQNFSVSEAYLRFNKKCTTNFTYWMGCVKSHGSWGGVSPFSEDHPYENGPIMVLTRARVKFSKVVRFLSHVPLSTKSLQGAKGLIYTKGIGEWPLFEQATFSYWDSKTHMEQYAYQSIHRDIIQKAKKEKWYREELFVRFIPLELEEL